jgi:hypothetical protein
MSIKAIYLVNLCEFTAFRYYPMVDNGDGCMEPIRALPQEGAEYPQYTIFGVKLVLDPSPKKTLYERLFGGKMPAQPRPVEEPILDVDTMAEAIDLCRRLTARMEGRQSI